MYIHRSAKLGYLACPRTASRSTRKALEPLGFVARKTTHHSGIPDGFDRTGWDIATTIRNPFDTLVSWWYMTGSKRSRQSKLTADYFDFVQETSPQFFPVRDRMFGLHAPHADTWLRYETIDEDLNAWLATRGLGPVKLPYVGDWTKEGRKPAKWVKQRPPWQDVMPEATAQQLAVRWADEMQELGYDAENR